MKKASLKNKKIVKDSNRTSHLVKPQPHAGKQKPQESKRTQKTEGLTHLPTIQQLLAIPKEERLNRSSQIFEQVKPFLCSFMQKKQGSRVTQLLFKWGNHSAKTTIYKQIIKNWKDLIKSKYALYIIAKVSREFELPGLIEDFTLLQNNREGAQILENFIHSSPSSETVTKLKEKIHHLQSKAKEQSDIKAQQYLDNMAIKSVEKQYYWFTLSKIILRLRLSTMFEEQKLKVIQKLVPNIAPIVNDEQGVRLFIELMNCCSSKDKKTLIKQYKGHIDQIVKANNVSYVSVIKLITEIDDTVLVWKTLGQELVEMVPEILTCKKAFGVIFSLFSPRNNNFNILGKYQPQSLHSTCKKPEELRKREVRQNLYEPLLEFLKTEENLAAISKNPIENKLIMGLYKSMKQDNHPQYKQFLTSLLDYYLKVSKANLKDMSFAESIIADGNASKVIKAILLLQEDFVESYCEKFASLFVKNAKVVLSTKASFILLGILQKGGREYLVKDIVKSGVQLNKAIAGQHFEKLLSNLNQ